METFPLVALIVLDGWGIREFEHGNAVAQANLPNYRRWLKTHERAILDASGKAVGLPQDQMGNSEVGHLNLGAGRIVYQDLTRIDLSIETGEFNQQPLLQQALERVRQTGRKLHLIGLLGPGGVHSVDRHMYALLELAAQNGVTPILHVITDGRDTPPQSAESYLERLQAYLDEHEAGIIASVTGRYYAMDRDKRWERTAQAYEAIVDHRAAQQAGSALAAIRQSYADGVNDEFVKPTVIETTADVTIDDGDAIIFFNFRADRMRQIVTAVTVDSFSGFDRPRVVHDPFVITMTAYEEGLPVNVLFPDQEIVNVLADVLSAQGYQQFHAAETEKYAHVTYFFNGGAEEPYANESRHLEPSPKVATYDLQPEMSAYPLTEAVLERLRSHDDSFILVNYANPDMVGHTGVLEAAIAAVEAVDECAGRLVEAVTARGGVALVTADHGNAETMLDEKTGKPHTYHTTNPVSLFIIGPGDRYFRPYPRGILADVAPTALALLGIPQPTDMTGRSLIDET